MSNYPTIAGEPNRPSDDDPGAPSAFASAFGTEQNDPRFAIPTQLGPYHILGRLGAGGMGEVYKAERRGSLRQIVAIKIIKLGFDSREVIARFESERQALSRMNHPNVARVLDAGTDENGRPYFVMEYVPGVPVTQFADTHKLSIDDRLKLFQQACDAIAHAHTKAIIHRDIKDANVLAYMQDNVPTIKVIDFGIAKALTSERLTDATFNTGSGQVIGTYDSMSPEQADSSPDIDTRTDVYSLGVLLYELLTGYPPFDRKSLAKSGEQEIRRIIRQVEPPRPSTRLRESGISANEQATLRQTQLPNLANRLKRELEWIPLKALRKERSRRYESPQQLSLDIQYYLDGKPLLAGPESKSYRARKMLARNPMAFLISAVSLLLITGGTAVYIHQIRAEQRRTRDALADVQLQKAQAERQESEAKRQASIANALRTQQTEMLMSSDPNAISHALDELDSGKLKDQPLEEANQRNTIGYTLVSRGQYDSAFPVFRRALEIRRTALPSGDPQIAESVSNLATVLRAQGKLAEAEPLFREAVDAYKTASPPRPVDLALGLNNLALLLQDEQKTADAEPLFLQALSLRKSALPANDPLVAQSMMNLALLEQTQGKLEEAERDYHKVLEIDRATLKPNSPEIATILTNLGYCLMKRGDSKSAEPLLREAMQIDHDSLPPNHIDLAWAANVQALILYDLGKFAEAEIPARESLKIDRATLKPDDARTLSSISTLGRILAGEAKYEEAEPLLREAFDARRQKLGPHDPNTVRTATALADLLDKTNRAKEAQSLRADCGIATK